MLWSYLVPDLHILIVNNVADHTLVRIATPGYRVNGVMRLPSLIREFIPTSSWRT